MALREVNLIPPEVLSRRQVVRHLGFWFTCLVCSVVLIWGSGIFYDRLVLARDRPLVNLDEVDTDLEARIERIRALKKELERLHERQAVLRSVTRNRPYSEVLVRLADVMNGRTWLSELSVQESKERKGRTEVEMTGYCLSNEDLGDFISALTATLVFRDVVLRFANEVERPQGEGSGRGPSRVIEFQLACIIGGG